MQNINDKEYRIVRISKKNGLFRNIFIPSVSYSEKLDLLLPKLYEILRKTERNRCNFAFEKNRNCALMAYNHVGYKFSLSLDIEDFFDSITEKHLIEYVPHSILNQCLINGAPRQGLKTSPVLSNIAFAPVDDSIIEGLADIDCIYTRYADDLIFSFNDEIYFDLIFDIVYDIINRYGFKINRNKINKQATTNGRRIITGIGVDDFGIHPTRKTKKKLRAALHENNKLSYLGLKEWSKCKLPKSI